MNYKPYKPLPPFKGMVLQNFPFIEEDFDAITNYQLLCKIVEYLKNVIANELTMEENVTNLYNSFVELKNYIDNYFDNLDVQEEIDNKLDEMVEDGTLTDIIGDYIEFSKKSYIIQEITYDTLDIENNKGKVFVTRIPHKDSNGDVIPIKHGFANGEIDNGVETATEFSFKNNATFVANASVFSTQAEVDANISLGELLGVYIHNGELIKDNREFLPAWFTRDRYILGIKENNVLESYLGNTSSSDLINDGVIECLQSFIPILKNGVNYRNQLISDGCTYWDNIDFDETEDETPIYNKIYYTYENNEYVGHLYLNSFDVSKTYYEDKSMKYPRQVICQHENGDIYFITNNGKGEMHNVGLTLYDFVTIAKYYNCKFAFVLDGGGSTTSVYRNEMINNPCDEQTNYSRRYNGLGYGIRKVPDFLYFSKDIKTDYDKDINYLLSKIQELNKRIDSLTLNEDTKFMSNTNFYEQENEQHIFNFKKWDDTLKNFVNSMQIYFDNPTSYKGGLNIYDATNNRNVLRVHNNIPDGIQFFGAKLGLMFDQVRQLSNNTDLNSLSSTFVFSRANQDQGILNKPFTGTECYNFIIWQFGWDSIRVQIAFGISQAGLLKMRVYTTYWGEWKTLNIT